MIRPAPVLHILNEIAEDKASIRTRIARLSGETADAPINLLPTLSADLQRATAAHSTITLIEFDIEDIADRIGSIGVERALMQMMHQVAQRMGDAAMNLSRESKEAVEGKVGVLRATAFFITEAFSDQQREAAKASA
jgi:hypothetical protein